MRLASKIAVSLGLVLALSCVALYLWLRGSLPSHADEVQVAGLATPVEIVRGRHAVPHVFGADERHAAFGLGFAHAQDRLWQMEFSRRMGQGRLAEAMGAGLLPSDKKMRTLGLARAAEHTIARLDGETLGWLQAYADGINAFLETRPTLPPEFLRFGVQPQPWRPTDSVLQLKLIAYQLGSNWQREATRAHLLTKLGMPRAAEFLALESSADMLDSPDLRSLYERLPLQQVAALEAPRQDSVGSNNWVVGPERSVTGSPLLADDPHVFLSAPSLWYLARLSIDGRNVVGASIPGMPGITIGRNDRVAWGVTDAKPDVQDLYVEQLKEDDGTAYLTPEGWRHFTVRREVIAVKGAPNVTLHVRETRHGPVVSDLADPIHEVTAPGHVIALAWTALVEDDISIRAFRRINQAQSAAEFRESLRDLSVPQLSFVYADDTGHFGFLAPGRIPVRHQDNKVEGRLPVPGWNALYDWQGQVPYEELPRQEDPASQAAWTANSRIVSDDYPHFMTHDWALPHRALRIEALLSQHRQHSLESFKALQADVISLRTRELLPLMLASLLRPVRHAEIVAALAAWDGSAAMNRPEQSIYAAWYQQLSATVHADEFGELVKQHRTADLPFIMNVLRDVRGQGRWCDDVRTASTTETCGVLLESTLDRALADLRQRLGGDWHEWTWGRLHHARAAHAPLSGVPLLGSLFDIVIPAPGGEGAVNVSGFDGNFEMSHGASLRVIFDLADIEQSLFITQTGQSGHFLSRYHDDLTPLWRDGQYIGIPIDREVLEAQSLGTVRLEPVSRR